MRFVVEFRDRESPKITSYPCAVLVQDNWDDFGYKSTFLAFLYLSAEEKIDLGNIKIIQAGSEGGYTEMPRKPFEQLSVGMHQLGQISRTTRLSTNSAGTSFIPILRV